MTDGKPLEKWTVPELKAELKKRDLSVQGVKADLLKRLQEAMEGENGEGPADASVEEKAAEAPSIVDNDQTGAGEAPDDAAPEAAGDADPVDAHAAEGEAGAAGLEHDAETADQEVTPAAEQQQQQGATEESAQEPDFGPEEWERMDIPESWLPAPIIRVRNIPESSTVDDVKQLLESVGAPVRSIVFDESEKKDGKQAAIVRLQPMPLPWTLTEEDLAVPLLPPIKPTSQEEEQQEAPAAEATDAGKTSTQQEGEEAAQPEEAAAEGSDTKKDEPAAPSSAQKTAKPEEQLDDGRRDGNASKTSRYYAVRLTERQLELGAEKLQVDAAPLSVTLFIGNVTDDEERLRTDMEQFGTLERCFIMRNPEGSSKGYGFAEYSLPSGATKAKDELENRFRQEFNAVQAKRISIAQIKRQMRQQQQYPQSAVEGQAEGAEAAAKMETDAPAEAKPVGASEEEQADAEVKAEGTDAEKGAELKAEAVKGEEVAEEQAAAGAAEAAAGDAGKTEATASKEEAEEDALVKIMRAEFMNVRTVHALYAKNLYLANLPQNFTDENVLKSVFEVYGPITSVTIARTPAGHSKGYSFVEFRRSDHAETAMKAMDGVNHPVLGRLLVSFQNPAKQQTGPADLLGVVAAAQWVVGAAECTFLGGRHMAVVHPTDMAGGSWALGMATVEAMVQGATALVVTATQDEVAMAVVAMVGQAGAVVWVAMALAWAAVATELEDTVQGWGMAVAVAATARPRPAMGMPGAAVVATGREATATLHNKVEGMVPRVGTEATAAAGALATVLRALDMEQRPALRAMVHQVMAPPDMEQLQQAMVLQDTAAQPAQSQAAGYSYPQQQQAGYADASGQKRPAEYSYQGQQGAYGYSAGYGQDPKRPRY
eukprot:CAMPEP_0202896070 /NCGR_PEP_ID=MMETSP1392-20130828/5135_1 /ASSEMBLY_ACC=CAM_ASM_000868 /TAXON_ID=225041 /ORGANISM="Chlamydomonas chlamydogama, Strain SAG 11-48b" /LENGTH=882 /DNA_ID=CAMNT_0049581299 /DNA_START=95 /DNA_END=2743 /DNA_ORIENTATION=+